MRVASACEGMNNLRDHFGKSIGPDLLNDWKSMGWRYDEKQRLLTIKGYSDWEMYWKYLGANDQAGPNYTGQEAVNSYYSVASSARPNK